MSVGVSLIRDDGNVHFSGVIIVKEDSRLDQAILLLAFINFAIISPNSGGWEWFVLPGFGRLG